MLAEITKWDTVAPPFLIYAGLAGRHGTTCFLSHRAFLIRDSFR